MKKRFLSLILSAVMILPVFASVSYAAEKDYTEEVNVLSGIGMLKDFTPKTFRASNKVFKKNFIKNVLYFMTDEVPDGKELEIARTYNLITDEELSSISSSDYITFEEAARIMLKVIGYSDSLVTNSYGAYPDGYVKAAASLKLTDGMATGIGEEITNGDMATMFYNALDTDVVSIVPTGSYVAFEYNDGVTAIEAYRNIEEIHGIVVSTGQTSLIGEAEIDNGLIMMDNGDIYNVGSSNAEEFLGRNVRMYVQENAGEFVVKYIGNYRENNNILTLKDEDIENISDDMRTLTYINENGNTKTAKLSPTLRFIYNGSAYFDYKKEDFIVTGGEIELIDNNNDNVYDSAFVEKYETMVVDFIAPYSSSIINKYKNADAVYSVDYETNDYTMTVYDGSIKAGLADIKTGDVLNIARSKDGKTVTAYITRDKVSGQMTKRDGNRVYINNVEYELNSEFVKETESSNGVFKSIEFGKSYDFILDKYGRIAAYSAVSTDSYSYMLMLKLLSDEDSERVYGKFMDMQENWSMINISEKVRVTSDTYTNERIDAQKLRKSLVDAEGKIIPQMVQVKLNEDGEVSDIRLAQETNEYDEDKLTVRKNLSGNLRWTVWAFDLKWYLDTTYNVVYFPNSISYDEDDYSVGSSLEYDTVYTFDAYNLDDYFTTNLIVINGSNSEKGTKLDTLFVVDKVAEAADVDGGVKKVLYGSYGNYINYSVYPKENELFEDIQPGDILRLYRDNRGRISGVDIEYSSSGGLVPVPFPTSANKYGNIGASGFVEKIDRDRLRFVVDHGEEKVAYLMNKDSRYATTVYIHDVKNHTTVKSSETDIMVGDFVYVGLETARPRTVVIYRNY